MRVETHPDEAHEALIWATYRKWLEGEAKWQELEALINARSPAQVERMERERGLV